MPRFVVQSHRGAGILAPENTIAAFELGWRLGTIPEADVRTTSDGVIVAFHDGDFSRVVHDASPELKKKGVKDVTFAELSRLEVGAESPQGFQRRHVSSMAEIFEVMQNRPERRLYLDIKQVDLSKLAELVRQANVGPQVILASTKIEIIREWNALVPNAQTLHWMGGTEEKLRARIEALRQSDFAGVTQLQIHIKQGKGSNGQPVIEPSEDFLREVARELKPRGIVFQALPWGGRDAAVYRQLLALGVESFATDYPQVTMRAMRDHFAENTMGFLRNGVTAHRGSSTEFPENTLPAFRHAIELGADWVELDVYQTRDGQLVVSHDATTKRTGDRDLKIADATYEELRTVDVAAQFRSRKGLSLEACPRATMPLLSDVLTLVQSQRRTRVSLQPKDGCTQAAVELVRQMRAVPWVGFNDGDLVKMSLVKQLEPNIPVFWDRPATSDIAADLRTAQERGFEMLVIEQKGITAERIRQIQEAGLLAGAWTVNDPARMRQFLAWGLDRIYTDDPRALLGLVATP